MKRLTALLVLCPFLLLAGFAGSARATSPTSEPVDQTFDFVDPTLCSFPVHVQVTYLGDFVTFYDRNGTPVRAQQRLRETDMFTAHGKTLVGQENTLQSITFVDGQPSTLTVHGLLFTHVRLPGGRHLLGERWQGCARHLRKRRQLPWNAHHRTTSATRRILRRTCLTTKAFCRAARRHPNVCRLASIRSTDCCGRHRW